MYAIKDKRLNLLYVQIITEKSTNKIGGIYIRANNHIKPVEELIESIYFPFHKNIDIYLKLFFIQSIFYNLLSLYILYTIP